MCSTIKFGFMRQTNPSQIEETHTAGNGFIINCQYSKRLNQLPDKTIFKDCNLRRELVNNKMFLFYHSYLFYLLCYTKSIYSFNVES